MATSDGGRLLRYLYSTKNVAGSMLAMVGLVLFFTGVVGSLWPAVVVGLYLIGALVAPATARFDLRSSFDATNLRRSLDDLVHSARGLPNDLEAKVQGIAATVTELLPKAGRMPAGAPERYVLERTVDDYLPTALEAYLNLPRAYAAVHPVQDGKTARQILSDQLDLLDREVTQVAEAVHQDDTDRLLSHGRFLEERFGRSQLELGSKTRPAPTPSPPAEPPGPATT